MLAIAYLAAILVIGHRLTQRFFRTYSLVHRVSAAFLVGLLVATWLTYLVAAIFAGLDQPLLVGALAVGSLAALMLRDVPRRLSPPLLGHAAKGLMRSLRLEWKDFAILGVLTLVVTWLMVSTFRANGNELIVSNHVYSDFGPTMAITQSFAVGNNFPTVYPHFAGEPIRYHFLFYFQAGNLGLLGLDPALALNTLSILSVAALLGLVMTLGRLLFRSRVVGWVGAGLFFFSGTLAWATFLAKQPSIAEALDAASAMASFLPSGFPYRGEEWGVWSMVIFANQRHFAGGIGVMLLVLVFLVGRYRAMSHTEPTRPNRRPFLDASRWRPRLRSAGWLLSRKTQSYAFAGLLLGALPMWNGAVFVAAFVVLATLLVLLPGRRYMLVLAAAAALASLPQIEFLRPSAGANASFPAFHWGYTIDDPTPLKVAEYIAFTFGPKLLIGAAALFFVGRLARTIFVAGLALVVVTFTVQFSAETLINHKFLNIWLMLLNLFVAYTLWRLWRARPVLGLSPGRLAAAILGVVITVSGLIDLMPFRNGFTVGVAYRDDRLVEWVKTSTQPRDVFLTDTYVTHPVLMAGRSLYLGWTYFAWGAGYEVAQREELYRRMFTETDSTTLLGMLRANGIDYVVFDDGLRSAQTLDATNEEAYRANLAVAFEDAGYGNIRIYAVP